MKGATTLGAICTLASTAVASVIPVYTHGNAFWTGSERFYIRGVDYQPGGSSAMIDPIADPAICERDIPFFKQLGINTIRVYTVDNSKNHDHCMNALAAAGIYLALDVNNALYSINRDDPAPSYNNVYLQSVFATIDAFQSYDNTLLFFSGNEVINAANNTNTAPYIKAVGRDMKNYIQSQSYRQIPVGYSAADVTQNRVQTAEYMNCGSDGMARSDFFAFNDYSYCDSSFVVSGWNTKVQTFSSYSLPLFLSEYGCNTVLPRTFTELQPLYSHKMTPVYSGGLLYEYTEEIETPNFGLVKVSGNNVQLLGDYGRFKTSLQQNPSPSGSGGFKASLSISQCPPKTHNWDVDGEGLPAVPAPAEKYFKQGAGPGPGLKGVGSQNAGVPSTGTVTVSSPAVTESASTGTPDNGSTGSTGSTGSSPAQGSGAGSLRMGPIVCAVAVIVSSCFGYMLL